jgi:heterogeneous nuclear ribonucleoprotein A1/A3
MHRGVGGARRGGVGALPQHSQYGYGQQHFQSHASTNLGSFNNANNMNQGRYSAGGAGFARGGGQLPSQGYGFGRDSAGGRGGGAYGGNYGVQNVNYEAFGNAGAGSDIGNGNNTNANASLSANAPSFRPQFSASDSVFGSSASTKTDFDYLSSGSGLGRIAVGSSQTSPLFSTTSGLSGLGEDWGTRFGRIDGGASSKNALNLTGNSFFNVDSLSKALPDVVNGSGLGLGAPPGLGSFGNKTTSAAAFFDQGEDIILDNGLSGEAALDSIIDYTQDSLSADDK